MEAAITALTSRIEKLNTRLSDVETKLAQGPPAAGAAPVAAAAHAAAPAASAAEAGPAQQEFDALVEEHIKPLIPLCDTLNAPILKEQMQVFLKACEEQSKLIGAASRSKKPTEAQMPKVLETLSKLMGQIAEYKDKNSRAKEFNNIAAVAEGVAALGWVAVEPKPAPFMADVIPGSEFYSNRVLTAFKGKDENEVKWAKEFIAFLKNLQAYVKKTHTTGLAYNANGGDMLAAMSSSAAAPAAAPACGGCPPPPPPPPPAGLLIDAPAAAPKAAASGADMGAVFSALNKGTDISKGLKHVTSDQKTKNRSAEEKAKGGIAPKEVAKKEPAASAKKVEKVRPPVKTLNGNKWNIENQVNAQIVIEESEIERNHSFYIGNCKGTTVTIKGKINSVTIDNCTKTGVVLDNVVAVIEVVNSTGLQLQVTGVSPSVNIDKCSDVQLYLSADAVKPESATSVYTSKCSSINVLIPGATADSDLVEMPIPEQFTSTVKNGKLVTEISSMGGF